MSGTYDKMIRRTGDGVSTETADGSGTDTSDPLVPEPSATARKGPRR